MRNEKENREKKRPARSGCLIQARPLDFAWLLFSRGLFTVSFDELKEKELLLLYSDIDGSMNT